MYIVMLGKPGSGKGTVGKMLSKKLGIVHISSGEMFRSYIKKAGKLGEEIDFYISKGNLVPDDLAIKLVEKRLQEKDCENGVILDGFPRTVAQAKELDRFLKEKNKKVDIAVELALTDKDIISRTLNRLVCSNKDCREVYNLEFKKPLVQGICDICGNKLEKRDDDNLETVKTRLENYKITAGELTNYYKEQDLLYEVKLNIYSKKTSEDVANDIEKKFK